MEIKTIPLINCPVCNTPPKAAHEIGQHPEMIRFYCPNCFLSAPMSINSLAAQCFWNDVCRKLQKYSLPGDQLSTNTDHLSADQMLGIIREWNYTLGNCPREYLDVPTSDGEKMRGEFKATDIEKAQSAAAKALAEAARVAATNLTLMMTTAVYLQSKHQDK